MTYQLRAAKFIIINNNACRLTKQQYEQFQI